MRKALLVLGLLGCKAETPLQGYDDGGFGGSALPGGALAGGAGGSGGGLHGGATSDSAVIVPTTGGTIAADTGSPTTDARPAGADVALSADASGLEQDATLLSDAGPPPPPPPQGRVCCVAEADCEAGRRCSGGRCWDPIPEVACDAGNPCADGGGCVDGRCAPMCGCVEASCPAGAECITDDRACGICVQEEALCRPACNRDLSNAPFAYLAADPLMHADAHTYEGVLVSDERQPGGVGRRFELEDADGVRQAFLYVMPPRVALPFALGESVRAEISGLQQQDLDIRAALSGPEGVRVAVVGRRGGAPTTYLDVPFHLEFQGCMPTLIGNCLQASPATVVFDVDGARSPVANTGDSVRILGWSITVARAYRDENVCQPELHDLYANFVMLRAQP